MVARARAQTFCRGLIQLLCAFGFLVSPSAFAKSKCDDRMNVHMHYDDYIKLTPAQKAQYNRYNEKYVDLDNQPMPDWLREESEDTREWVKDVLGFLPEIKRGGMCPAHCMIGSWVLHMWEPGVKKKESDNMHKGNEIATFTYRIPMSDPNKLVSSLIWVDKDYRDMALSELLTLETLALYPWIKRIEVERFDYKNLKVYQKALDDGMKCKDRIRETYSYKKFERLGFTKIVDFECFMESEQPEGPFDIPNAKFTVERP